MTRGVAISLAILLGACSAVTTETEDEIRISFGSGGFVNNKLMEYIEYERSGKRIVIDGQVVSADAFYAFAIPNACYTKNAVFSPHAASYMGILPNPELTRNLASLLPTKLKVWFENDFSYHDWIGFARLDYDGLRKVWPEGECDSQVTAAAAAKTRG